VTEHAPSLHAGWTPSHAPLGAMPFQPWAPTAAAPPIGPGQRLTRTLAAPAVHDLLREADRRLALPSTYRPPELTRGEKALLAGAAVIVGLVAGSVLAHRVKRPRRGRSRAAEET
jgi:hypothetical protein